MTGKPKTTRQPRKRNPNALEVKAQRGEVDAQTMARTALRPTVQAGLTLKAYGQTFGDLDLTSLVDVLDAQVKAVNEGTLARADAMLTSQVHTLDAIFNKLARMAIDCDMLNQLDALLKLALRAQSQSRATWETLAVIKNPPVAGYVRQANIAHGHQQVNNGPVLKTDTSRVRENENPPTQLLEQTDGNRLDTRAPGTAGEADSRMEAVEPVHRPEVAGR